MKIAPFDFSFKPCFTYSASFFIAIGVCNLCASKIAINFFEICVRSARFWKIVNIWCEMCALHWNNREYSTAHRITHSTVQFNYSAKRWMVSITFRMITRKWGDLWKCMENIWINRFSWQKCFLVDINLSLLPQLNQNC